MAVVQLRRSVCVMLAWRQSSCPHVASAAQANKFVQAMASEPNGCQVTIHTSEAFSGEITVSVDSSEYDDLYI